MRAQLLIAVAFLFVGQNIEAKSKEWVTPEPFGGCKFFKRTMAFEGDTAKQTACLLKKVKEQGGGAVEQPIPEWLRSHVGKQVDISDQKLKDYLNKQKIAATDVGGPLAKGAAQKVRYFVIHDTSFPEIPEAKGFPADMDDPGYEWNDIAKKWKGSNLRLQVNLIVSRDGRSHTYYAWGETRPRSATKLELSGKTANIPEARPLFVHVENIQPRLKPTNKWAWIAPPNGLSPKQEERLALLYITASYQAGTWLIPAYHFNIDQGIPQGHDDPQHMDLASWVGRIQAIHNLVEQ
ncbi:conserved exported hypothetical protein [uncultured Pleomorphomonas sp.]|uniref:Uncharacterized protein n=1 Tax=uncultured Pleomorphomonas sp. TaxID=442121 RepID=A0A212LQA9_9HYPH|nr:hypothetical protein [uncultured Pleomorphomonas sp.]SCM79723.1 conserved exported hypothetical protein [uncultured Pleomorphomonas sp.]